ncbi:unnamed protein product [Cylicocyclus nassatus]|uniref:Uncharacterized protein n=1 Tax=Cylicocyclus nassatus TaxID=53992 RepID=A0AA36DU15_CYLNA|nr:unnamed protein product [Cylicocyclus nassatus]
MRLINVFFFALLVCLCYPWRYSCNSRECCPGLVTEICFEKCRKNLPTFFQCYERCFSTVRGRLDKIKDSL